jgi:hypothetical protein
MGRVMTPAAAALRTEIVETVRAELATGRPLDRHAIARAFQGKVAPQRPSVGSNKLWPVSTIIPLNLVLKARSRGIPELWMPNRKRSVSLHLTLRMGLRLSRMLVMPRIEALHLTRKPGLWLLPFPVLVKCRTLIVVSRKAPSTWRWRPRGRLW